MKVPKKSFSIYLTEDLVKYLDDFTAKEGLMSRSAAIQYIVTQELKNKGYMNKNE